MSFTLHPQLEKDSFPVITLDLCDVRLQNNRLFTWLVLIPKLPGLREIIDLSESDRALLMQEICVTSEVLKSVCRPDKLNVGALGNVVPQLHVHVIARFKNDAAWDMPVWGRGSEPYTPSQSEDIVSRLTQAFDA